MSTSKTSGAAGDQPPKMFDYPKPPFPEQTQDLPGSFQAMDPRPDHGEQSWRGAGRLAGMVALITGGDSGIGRAVAIAYAREGADILLSYLNETIDAADTARLGGAVFPSRAISPRPLTAARSSPARSRNSAVSTSL